MYPKIKKVVFWVKLWENSLLFSVSVLLVFFFLKKHNLCAKKSVLFPLSLKLFKSFSLHFKAQKNQTKKTFIFCFCPVPFLIDFFFQHFSLFFTFITIVFVHFSFSSKCSSLLVFLSFFFSLFSPSFFFSLSQCFSSSFFLNLMFPYLFSIAVFVYLLLD